MDHGIKWFVIVLAVLIGSLYFLFFFKKIPLVEELPTVMQKQYDVILNKETNQVTLEKNGIPQSIGITIDQDKTIYIANSAIDYITKFKVDKENKEIYLRKNPFNAHEGDNDKFQLIQVTHKDYKEIVRDQKVIVTTDFGQGYYEQREYNLETGDYRTLHNTYPTK